jgi:cytoskeletal protein CcmA (bactofilin family)
MSVPTSFRTEISTFQAVLANVVTVMGEILSNEPLTIEGEVEGAIDVAGHLLTIAPNGNVRASVKAREIDVLGSLQGNVDGADKIYIRNGARFVGDIRARAIVIEDGGFIRGKVDLSPQAGVSLITPEALCLDSRAQFGILTCGGIDTAPSE